MYSVGIDLVEIARIENSIQSERFFKTIFGENERKEFEKKNFKVESIAGAFAAKEAFSKAIKTGLKGFKLSEVEVLHDENRAPYLCLSGSAKMKAEKDGLEFDVSITHTKTLAQAIVIAYKK